MNVTRPDSPYDETTPSYRWFIRALEDRNSVPIAFALVREDPQVELALALHLQGTLNRPPRIAMVASGGCTLALLSAKLPTASITAIDMNPAQIALSKLKLDLLQTEAPERRLALLGHQALGDQIETQEVREKWLSKACTRLSIDSSALGDTELVNTFGLDYSGRYELLFRRLQRALSQSQHVSEFLNELLSSDSVEHQTLLFIKNRHYATTKTKHRIRDYFRLPILVSLFGEGATQNPYRSFAAHFANQFSWACKNLPLRDNTFMWQWLMGRYPKENAAQWLTCERTNRLADVSFELAPLANALVSAENTYDLIHASNTLDWLSATEAASFLQVARKSASTGSLLVIRQLNSSLNVPSLLATNGWELRSKQSQEFTSTERSFFYRHVWVAQAV